MGSLPKRLPVSPLRYPGGKGSLYLRFSDLLKNNNLFGCRYVEPYAGGAGAALSLLITGAVDSIVINDLDPKIAAFWWSVVNRSAEMMSKVESVCLTVDEWKLQKAIYQAGDQSDLFSLGFATLFLNRTNRSGVLNAGPIGGMDQSGPYKIDARFNRKSIIERLRLIQLYSSKISVRNEDGLDVIRENLADPKTFVYADPPYYEKAGTLYLNAFRDQDHDALSRTLHELNDSNWVLTYDDVPYIRNLYTDLRIDKYPLSYSAHRARRTEELIIYSNPMVPVSATLPTE